MEDKTTTPSPDYMKGFNTGYLMEKDLPGLANKIANIKEINNYTLGFQDGRREWLNEKARELRNNRSTSRNFEKIDKPKDKDRDFDK